MPSVIIIGSGFGGSIAAKRFAAAGYDVTIMELGEDFSPAAKQQQSQDTKYIFRLFRDYPANYLQAKPKVVVTQGMGYGGGSLVYSGIHLRAPSTAFTGWPSGWTRAHLDPYYTRVETRLGVAPLPNGAAYKRSQAFAAGAAAAGLPAPQLNPLAMTGCTKCGWCVPICKYGHKNTMWHTYLTDGYNAAFAAGRWHVYCNWKARYIAKYGTKYRVVAWPTGGVTYNYHTVNSGSEYYFEADQVVVACGAIESPALLQRSMSVSLPAGYTRLNAFPTGNVGNGIDGTGDFVQGGIMPASNPVDGYKGAIMMNYIDRGNYVLEDIGPIPVGPSVKLECSFNGQSKAWGLAYKQKFKDFGRRMIGIGIMGKQGSGTGGNISVSDNAGNAQLSTTAYYPPDGPVLGDQKSVVEARAMITALGGEAVNTPWERSGTAATVHPTGGCRMGDDAAQWAVQATNLQVRNNTNLYVIDGSVVPGGVYRNPSNTIAAIAERAMDVILGVYAPTLWPS